MSDTTGIAQPQRVNFAQLMSGRYFIVPAYQRHYAWTEKECRELFEDCVLTARNPARERFMSTITVIAPAGSSVYPTLTDQKYAQLKPLLVVDGQQRLTSILILISCICREMLKSEADAVAVRNAYADFVSTPLLDNSRLLRVRPQRIPSHPHLMQAFLEGVTALERMDPDNFHPTLIPAQRRLREARETFERGLRDLAGDMTDQRVGLPDLLTCVASRLIFILNTLGDVGQAGEIFEGLNNRGLALSVLENLKAFSIYAVQSFRRHEVLPGGMAGTAAELNDDFNDAIGDIYHRLDRVGLKDDVASDLLSAAWPLVVSRVESTDLAKSDGLPTEALDRSRVMVGIRESLHIQNATTDAQQAVLLGTLRFMVCERLVPASEYFADARRPLDPASFEAVKLSVEEATELRRLHHRLAEMESSAPFLPILLAHRTMGPGDWVNYVLLSRLIERTAFRAYVLGERNRGAGQKNLTRLARNFVDRKVDFDGLLLSLRAFGISSGRSTDPSFEPEDHDELADRIRDVLDGRIPDARAALAYEWLLSKKVELPGFGSFLKAVRDERFLRLVNDRRGRLPDGFQLARNDVTPPGNIIFFRHMRAMTSSERDDFDALPYPAKRQYLKKMGYKAPLPQDVLTTDWIIQQRRLIESLALVRWDIPRDGRVTAPTWAHDITSDFKADADEVEQ